MLAQTQIWKIRQLQKAFITFSLLNVTNYIYPKDANVCDGDTYNYVVVGGGTSGLVVAARLVEANFTVLVIEAGDVPGADSVYPAFVPYLKNSRVDWNYTSETNSRTNRCLKGDGGTFYGKGLGGTGAVNMMIYGRGNPRDFEKFYEATGDSSWRWDNMLKYFKKSENLSNDDILNSKYKEFHGTAGKIGVTKEDRTIVEDYLKGYEVAGEQVVVDNVGSGIGLGYSKCLYTIANGKRSDTGNAYLPPLKNKLKLHVTKNSLATKIIFDKNKNAVGVEFVKRGKTITVKASKEVIVTAGPVKSPQILMLSGIGPKEELENHKIELISNIPVGKNLQCIVGSFLTYKTNREANPLSFDEHRTPAPAILGYSAVNKSSLYPDYETQNFIIDDYNYFLTMCAFTLKFKNSICDRLVRAADHKQLKVTVLLNINPKSRGSVSLYSKDPYAQPKIVYEYYSDEADLNAIIDYIQDYVKLKDTPYFQKLGLKLLEPTADCTKLGFGTKKYWRCYALCMVALTGRTTGTCAMGSVVDSQLRVLGVKRLRVVGSTVMPNSLGGSIFAPEVALAEKAAEMIAADGKKE